MSKATSLTKALQNWQAQHPNESFAQATEIKLIFQYPPIEKLETTVLNQLAKCEKLSLSSNLIDKMVNFPPMKNLTRLSLGRNLIKKISGLDQIAGNLRQLWLSYNMIQKLDGLNSCVKLNTLFIGNNRIKAWEELDKIKQLPELENVLFSGNPFYSSVTGDTDPLLFVYKKLPNSKNIDGIIITGQHAAAAAGIPDSFPPPAK